MSSHTPVKEPLHRERVLLAAVRLADERGLEALSMRSLAAALGVQAMSLYNHVAGKDDLLDGMVDLVIAEIALPAPSCAWKDALRERATSAREALMRHPWATALIVSRVNTGPAMLRYIDATLGCLHGAGFSYAETDRAVIALDSYVYGFTLQVQSFPMEPCEYASAAAQFLPQIPESEYPHMHALSVMIARGQYDGIHDFDFGLELLLDGLGRALARARKQAG